MPTVRLRRCMLLGLDLTQRLNKRLPSRCAARQSVVIPVNSHEDVLSEGHHDLQAEDQTPHKLNTPYGQYINKKAACKYFDLITHRGSNDI